MIYRDIQDDAVSNASCLMRARQSPHATLAVVTLGFFTDAILLTIIIPIIPSLLQNSVSLPLIGLLFSSKAILQIIFNIPMGLVCDRVGPRVPFLIGMAILCASTSIYAFAVDYGVLFAARAIQGVASAAVQSAGNTMIALSHPHPDARGKAMGLAMMGLAFGVLAGPPLGGGLYLAAGKQLPFFLVMGLAATDLVLQLVLLKPFPRGNEDKRPTLRQMLAVAIDPFVLVIAGALFIANGAIAVMEPTIPLYLENYLNIAPGMTGVVFMSAPIPYAVLSPIVGAIGAKYKRWPVMMIGLIGMAFSQPFTAFNFTPPHLAVTIVMLAMTGAFMALVDASCMPLVADVVLRRHGPQNFGVGFAVADIAVSLGFALGPIIGTTLVYRLGRLFWALVCVGGVMLLLAPFVGLLRKFEAAQKVAHDDLQLMVPVNTGDSE